MLLSRRYRSTTCIGYLTERSLASALQCWQMSMKLCTPDPATPGGRLATFGGFVGGGGQLEGINLGHSFVLCRLCCQGHEDTGWFDITHRLLSPRGGNSSRLPLSPRHLIYLCFQKRKANKLVRRFLSLLSSVCRSLFISFLRFKQTFCQRFAGWFLRNTGEMKSIKSS